MQPTDLPTAEGNQTSIVTPSSNVTIPDNSTVPIIPQPSHNKTDNVPVKPSEPVKPTPPAPAPKPDSNGINHNGLLDIMYKGNWIGFKTVLDFMHVSLEDFILAFTDVKSILSSIVYVVVTWLIHSIISVPLFFIYPYIAIQFFIGDADNWKRHALQKGIDSDGIQEQMFFYVRYMSLTSVAIMKGFDKNEIMKNPEEEDPKVIAEEFLLQWVLLGGETAIFVVLLIAVLQQNSFNIDFSRIIRFG